MFLFWRLILGHFLSDFTFQANWINHWKRSAHTGMLIHCLTHPVVYAVLTYEYLFAPWVQTRYFTLNGVESILIITFIHYLEDVWRVYTIKRFKTPDNTLYFAWDQIIHISSIFIFFGIQPDRTSFVIPEPWVIVGILAVGATHFSVVLAYFFDKDLHGKPYPGTKEKYVAIAERLAAFSSLAFLPNLWLGIILSLIVIEAPRIMLSERLKIERPPHFSWTVGSAIALICGLLARAVLAYF
ncbi:MAG: DUF3307 domain-containing protein [Elusimicrobiota bacterium]